MHAFVIVNLVFELVLIYFVLAIVQIPRGPRVLILNHIHGGLYHVFDGKIV